MAPRTAYSTWTPQKPTLFDGHYLRNHSTLDIGVLGYIGIDQHKEHAPEVLSIPPGTTCISIHPWCYSPFLALASLIRHLHSSLFAALLLHPLIPSSCRASLWTTSAHLVLGLPTGLVIWKFSFKTLFGILCSSILIIYPAHPSLLNLMSSTMFGSLFLVITLHYGSFLLGF